VDDQEAAAAEAVASLRAALLTGEGVADAVRRGFYRNPVFSSALLSESVREWFGTGADVRAVTRFTARIRSRRPLDPLGFPAREAEALIRVALGETYLIQEIDPEALDYLEIMIVVLSNMLAEWRPAADVTEALLRRAAEVAARLRNVAPGLGPMLDVWFEMGMHRSPLRGRARDPN
jgi:hypothetical protein